MFILPPWRSCPRRGNLRIIGKRSTGFPLSIAGTNTALGSAMPILCGTTRSTIIDLTPALTAGGMAVLYANYAFLGGFRADVQPISPFNTERRQSLATRVGAFLGCDGNHPLLGMKRAEPSLVAAVHSAQPAFGAPWVGTLNCDSRSSSPPRRALLRIRPSCYRPYRTTPLCCSLPRSTL